MNKCDTETKKILIKLLEEGCKDVKPRPHWEDRVTSNDCWYLTNDMKKIIVCSDNCNSDFIKSIPIKDGQFIKHGPNGECILCTPAHTLSYNHEMITYDLSKGEFPISTLRPCAIKSAIAEIIWIYVMQSNDLVVFDYLLGKNTWEEDGKINNWWKEWALTDENGNYILNHMGHPTIGCCYGETVRRHNLIDNLLTGLKTDPDGRRHIMNMWQEDDFLHPHGLKPCAFQTVWNVRHGADGVDYLDMCLFQRSSDFVTAGVINQAQYAVLLYMVARATGYTVGKFTWFVDNIQCYDRHLEAAKELIDRRIILCKPYIEITEGKTDFFNFRPEDIKLVGYPFKEIKEVNPQIKLDIAI